MLRAVLLAESLGLFRISLQCVKGAVASAASALFESISALLCWSMESAASKGRVFYHMVDYGTVTTSMNNKRRKQYAVCLKS